MFLLFLETEQRSQFSAAEASGTYKYNMIFHIGIFFQYSKGRVWEGEKRGKGEKKYDWENRQQTEVKQEKAFSSYAFVPQYGQNCHRANMAKVSSTVKTNILLNSVGI